MYKCVWNIRYLKYTYPFQCNAKIIKPLFTCTFFGEFNFYVFFKQSKKTGGARTCLCRPHICQQYQCVINMGNMSYVWLLWTFQISETSHEGKGPNRRVIMDRLDNKRLLQELGVEFIMKNIICYLFEL